MRAIARLLLFLVLASPALGQPGPPPGGGGGNVSGPGLSVNQYVPQWNGTTGTSLGGGLPVGLTGNSTIVETTSGGVLTTSLIPTSAALDLLGSAQGDVLYRGASAWVVLTPGTSGQFLQTQGASANPVWATPAGGGNVSGPGPTTNLYVPQWNGTGGTALGVGLPVGLTGNSTIVETTSSGLLTASLVPTSAALDNLGSTQGDILYRGASGWAVLAPGTSGQVLQSGGASANPSWVSAGGTGTVTVTGSTPTTGHVATFSGATSIQDGGSFGAYSGTGIVYANSGVPGSVTYDNTLTFNTSTGVLGSTAPDNTSTANYTIAAADMGGQRNYNGSSLTATIPAISSTVLASGMSTTICNYNSSALTISSTPTINGFTPTSIPGTVGGVPSCLNLLSNGTSLDPIPAFNNYLSTSATGQAFTGGIYATAYSNGTATSGTTTIDCGNGPLQTLTNGGAFTLAMASATTQECVLKITNNSSAGTISFSGFNEGTNTGDALTLTNGSIFFLSLTKITGSPHYLVSALQ